MTQTETPAINPTKTKYVQTGNEVIEGLQEIPTELQLSSRFQLSSLTKGGARVLRGGSSSKQALVKNLKALAEAILEPTYDLFPNMQILAGYRNREDIEDSSRNNLHYKGQAVDIRLDGFNRQETFDAAKTLIEKLPHGFDTITLNYNGKKSCWLHISFRLNGNRESFSTFRDHIKLGDNLQYIAEVGETPAESSGTSRLGAPRA